MNKRNLNSLLACKNAATAIEYALVAAFISMVIVASSSNMGVTLNKPYNNASNALSNANR